MSNGNDVPKSRFERSMDLIKKAQGPDAVRRFEEIKAQSRRIQEQVHLGLIPMPPIIIDGEEVSVVSHGSKPGTFNLDGIKFYESIFSAIKSGRNPVVLTIPAIAGSVFATLANRGMEPGLICLDDAMDKAKQDFAAVIAKEINADVEIQRIRDDKGVTDGSQDHLPDHIFIITVLGSSEIDNQNFSDSGSKDNDGKLEGVAEEFFKLPGCSYETLILGKFIKPDGTELKLPNTGIDSFLSLIEYWNEFTGQLLPNILGSLKDWQQYEQVLKKLVLQIEDHTPKEVIEKLNQALLRTGFLLISLTKQAEAIINLNAHIKTLTQFPCEISLELEEMLLRLDSLAGELYITSMDGSKASKELVDLHENIVKLYG